jgi:peroxiredoxin Q/BCP
MPLNAGDAAPDFALPDADMEEFALCSLRGKQALVLYFYLRDDTPACTTEAIEFTELEARFTRLGVVVAGVSRDECIRHGEFRDKHGISVHLLADRDGETCALYDVLREREVDGVKRVGVLRSTFIIDKQGVIRDARYGVNARGHAAETLVRVKELLA